MSITTVASNDNFILDSHGKVSVEHPDKIKNISRIYTSNRYLSLTIMPTENCNFRCTYCYEDFAVGRMKSSIIDGVKSLILKRCSELDVINISWFGGEPLVAKDVVLDISRFVLSMTYIHPGLRYTSNMTTNAYLLNYELASELSKVGIRKYQISLDGPRKIHDQTRLRADGASTFDKIWSNLLLIRDSSLPVNVMLRIHVTVDNYTYLDELLADIKREFLPDPRFSVFFKAIERLGSSNDSNIKQFSHIEQEKVIKALEENLFGKNHNYVQGIDPATNSICYASVPNSMIIRANGDIGKCTVALYDKRNKIATLKSDGTMEVIPGRLAPWVRGLETLDPTTLGCPLSGLPVENNDM
jgi:uncharacterized protein